MRHTIWERSTQIEQPGSPEIYSEKGSSLMSNWKMVTGGPVALISLDGILILRLWAIHPSLLSDLRESRVICGTRSARSSLEPENLFFHRFGLIQQSASCWQGRRVMVIVIDLCWINCRAQKQCQPLFADYWQSQLSKSATSLSTDICPLSHFRWVFFNLIPCWNQSFTIWYQVSTCICPLKRHSPLTHFK